MSAVNPHGQIFVGPALNNSDLDLIVKSGSRPAIEVEMAIFNEKNSSGLNDVLLKISGGPAAAAGIDGKTLRYHAAPAGTGTNFCFFRAGDERVRLTTRDTWGGWQTMQVNLAGSSIHLRAHPRGSADARPLHLETAYNELIGESPSRLQLERQLQPTSEAMKTKMTLKWSGFESDARARRAVALVLTGLAKAHAQVSADAMGREALAEIEAIEIEVRGKGGVEGQRKGKSLLVGVGLAVGDDQAAYDDEAQTQWLVSMLERAL